MHRFGIDQPVLQNNEVNIFMFMWDFPLELASEPLTEDFSQFVGSVALVGQTQGKSHMEISGLSVFYDNCQFNCIVFTSVQ